MAQLAEVLGIACFVIHEETFLPGSMRVMTAHTPQFPAFSGWVDASLDRMVVLANMRNCSEQQKINQQENKNIRQKFSMN